MRNVRLFIVPGRDLPAILRGELVITNLPPDAEFAGMHVDGNEFGIGIYSRSYPPVAADDPIPRVVPWTRRRGQAAA